MAEADTDPLAGWPAYAAAVRARLERGRHDYGDQSFSRAPDELLDEIDAELMDVAAYSYILHERLRGLRVSLRPLAERRRRARINGAKARAMRERKEVRA